MKAIVAEIDKKQMTVITENGDFIKVKRQVAYNIGDEIELKAKKKYLTYKGLARVAACFLACIFLTTGVYAYYTPYSYVSVDINPSLSLSLNRFGRVISVNPLDDDAVTMIKDIKDLKNHNIDHALSEIIKTASDKGYIDKAEDNQVMVVVSAKDPKEAKDLEGKVAKAASKELSKVNDSSEVMVEKTNVEEYKDALSNKVSPGKEILADKLRKVNPELKDEEIRDMPVKEAVKQIKEGNKAIREEEKAQRNMEKEERKNDKGKPEGQEELKAEKEDRNKEDKVKEDKKTEIENKEKDKNKDKGKDKNKGKESPDNRGDKKQDYKKDEPKDKNKNGKPTNKNNGYPKGKVN